MTESENFNKSENYNQREDIFSKAVRAGKRTYFFDVKATRANDYFLTITESKKRFSEEDEKAFYVKHKIFLYKEDFDKFLEGFNEAVTFIKNSKNSGDGENPSDSSSFTDVNFNDLG